MNIEKTKCLIIGSGPSGYTAAIYASRANLSPILYKGEQPGGQLTTTNDVENYPAFEYGISGTELVYKMENQAKRFGTDIRDGRVTKVDFSDTIKKVWVEDKEIHCDTVIISTGSSAKYLNLPSEQHYLRTGGGVSACAVCDGYFYKDMDVVIVGSGDSACEEAHYLSNICNTVTMLVRGDKFRASKIMEERVKKIDNINILYNTETKTINGDGTLVESVTVYNNVLNEEQTIQAKGFFVAIGHNPNTEIFKDYIELDNNGYIITVPDTTCTNISGVFASGDVADPIYRQAITSAGSGCKSALDAERYLANLSH